MQFYAINNSMLDIINHHQILYHEKNLQGKFCSDPWAKITIDNNGDVYSCPCVDWTRLVVGNVLKTPLEEIYSNSENLQKLRNSVLDGKFGWCKVGQCDKINNLPNTTKLDLLKVKSKKHFYLPTYINLGIEYNCNLKCGSCRSELHYKNEENVQVTQILSSLVNSYKDYKNITEIACDGYGDIFVSKSYMNLIFSDKVPDCWRFMLQTNGNLLSKRKSQILQIKDRINLINISIDASTPETYKIVRGGNWGIVMDGIEMIHELGIKGMIQLVLQRENYQDLLGFKELANKFDFWYQVQFMDRRQHMTEKYWNHNRIDNNPDVDYAQLKEYLNILKQDKNCNFDGGVQELYKSL